MKSTCLLEVAGYKIEVVDTKLWQASSRGDVLRVSLPLLRLDAIVSLAGERLAAALLLPYKPVECPPSLRARIEEAATTYRRRVVVEQLYDLLVRMGPLASEVLVDPIYPPASRLWLLRTVHSCLVEAAGPQALNNLRHEYASLAASVAKPEGNGLRLDPPTLRTEFRALGVRIRSTLASLQARAPMPRLPWEEGSCQPPGEILDPWDLARLPEGRYKGPCRDPLELVTGADCRAGGRLSSSYLCTLPSGEKVVVKDYMRMAAKWIPAAAASSIAVRYRLGPRSRLAADYKYLRLLRGVLPTPRFRMVCSDVARAAALREYVDGTPVLDSSDPRLWREAGHALAEIHEAGYALGDPNPGNFVSPRDGGRLWLIDAEQARPYTDRRGAWDLVVALAYAAGFGAPLELVEEMARAYASHSPRAARLAEKALSPALWLPLQAVPQAARARKALRRALERGQKH